MQNPQKLTWSGGQKQHFIPYCHDGSRKCLKHGRNHHTAALIASCTGTRKMGCSCPGLLDPISYKRKQSSALERTEWCVPGTAEESYSGGTSDPQHPILLYTPPMPTALIFQSGWLWMLNIILEIFSPEMSKGCFSTSAHLTFSSQQGMVLGNVP